MLKLLIRIVINAVAIWVAAEIVDGVTLHTENVFSLVLVALVFSIVNSLLGPLLKLLSLPFVVLTLGILALVINAAMFGLTAWLLDALSVTGFWPAFWGALITAVVSWFLGLFVTDDEKAAEPAK